MKNNYARIQTIAHECLHSCQDRMLLLFNFIFSNISIIYFLVISILTICKLIHKPMLQVAILMLILLIKIAVRLYLEIDAMTRAKYLAKEYIEKKKICTKEEQEKLLKGYENINKQAIPFTVFNLLLNELIKVFIYTIIAILYNIFL